MQLIVAIVWVCSNLLALWWVERARKSLPAISTASYVLLLLPFSKQWKRSFSANDLPSLERYRKRLLVWCYIVLCAPLLSLAVFAQITGR